MLGKPYMGNSRKQITEKPGRKIGPTCKSQFCAKSKNRNCSKFDEVSRSETFNSFWAMNWVAKKFYVRDMVSFVHRKRPIKTKSRRSISYKFFFEGG